MRIWAITGGRRGNDVLVLGIARALGYEPLLIHAQLNAPWRWLSPYRAAFVGVRGDPAIAPPFPDRVLAGGRQAAAHARFIGARSGGRAAGMHLPDTRASPLPAYLKLPLTSSREVRQHFDSRCACACKEEWSARPLGNGWPVRDREFRSGM